MHKVASGRDKYCQPKKHVEKPKITTLPLDKRTDEPELADEITDPNTRIRYKRGKLLGKVKLYFSHYPNFNYTWVLYL